MLSSTSFEKSDIEKRFSSVRSMRKKTSDDNTLTITINANISTA